MAALERSLTGSDGRQSGSERVQSSSRGVTVVLDPFHCYDDTHHRQRCQRQIKRTPATCSTRQWEFIHKNYTLTFILIPSFHGRFADDAQPCQSTQGKVHNECY